MDSYDNECSGSPDTFACTPAESGLMTAAVTALVFLVLVAPALGYCLAEVFR